MASGYDIIVIGAGHNGLTAAGLLAKRGRRVLVVERRQMIGGLCATEEFHPGYRHTGVLHDTARVRPGIVDALALSTHGVRFADRPADLLLLGDDGDNGLMLAGDVSLAAAAITATIGETEAQSYRRFRARIEELRPVLRSFLDQPPIDLPEIGAGGIWQLFKKALRLRLMGRKQMMELLRLPAMPVADWLGEWFEDDRLKAGLCLPAVAATVTGPRAPWSNLNLILYECAARRPIVGGARVLLEALGAAARQHGAEIRTGAEVEQIRVEGETVRGVVLTGGEEIDAGAVLATCDPRRALLQLVAPGLIPFRMEETLGSFRCRGTTAHVFLALDRPLRFGCLPETLIRAARTGGSINAVERAHDAIKYGEVSERPILDIYVPSVDHGDLAPDGHAVVSVAVHFAPHEHHAGWDDANRAALGDRVVETLAVHVPDLRDAIVGREVLTPADLEARYGITGGHLDHGEHAVDQLLIRPVPGCTGCRTPIAGLFLGGSGSHPGGGVTCAPGALAAKVVLAG